MTEFDFVDDLSRVLRPLGVTVTMATRDSTYYVNIDATSGMFTKEKWIDTFGISFEQMVTRNMMVHYVPLEVIRLTDLSIEFKIGTLFDLLRKSQDE